MPRPNDISVGSAVKSIRHKILDIPLPETVQTEFDTNFPAKDLGPKRRILFHCFKYRKKPYMFGGAQVEC